MSERNLYSPPTADVADVPATASEASVSALNPWTSMWVRPRATIQRIIETNPEKHVLLLAALAGISDTLDRASRSNTGDKIDLGVILATGLIAGSFFGIIMLYLVAGMIRWTGRWIGGQSSTVHIRAAIAWASLPKLVILALWIPMLGIFGKELFTAQMPTTDADMNRTLAFTGLATAQLILAAWAVVIFCKALGQVQHFSAWKALGNALLAGLALFGPIIALVLAVKQFG